MYFTRHKNRKFEQKFNDLTVYLKNNIKNYLNLFKII